MRRTIIIELHKIATMRMALAIAAAGLALVALFTLVTLVAAAPTPRDGLPGLSDEDGQRLLLSSGSFAAVALVVLGVLVTAGEYRHRTIIASLLVEPRRARLMWAKVAIVATLGGIVGAAAAGLAIGGGLAGLHARGLSLELSGAELAAIGAGTACYVALLAVIGCAAGALLHEQITAVATTLAVLWILDPLVSQLVPEIERLGPGGLGRSVTGAPVDDSLGATAAALVLAAAALLLVLFAIRRQRGDVVV